MGVRKGYLGGTDQQRAEDLNAMFADENIKGIFCGRGGYGSGRILPYLNYDLIRSNPKVFIGFSDITALLYGIFGKTGLVCFHGPMGGSEYNDYTTKNLKTVVMEPPVPPLTNALRNDTAQIPNTVAGYLEIMKENKILPEEVQTISQGTAEGILVGGNLSLMSALNCTAYDLDFRDKLVFLEEVGEAPYRIDRMLTQLLQTEGKLRSAAGIVLGRFNDCEAEDLDRSLSLYETLHDRLSGLGIPVLYGLSFGHINKNLTIPFGIKAKLDTEAQTLTLLEAGVL
jgi:muramoyltetrapeptide carboxypeptidase